jgi:hypothetical protein
MKSAMLLISCTRWNVYCSWRWYKLLLVSLLFLKSQKRSEKTVQTTYIEQENSGDYNQWVFFGEQIFMNWWPKEMQCDSYKAFWWKKCQAIRFEGERKCQSRRISWEFKLKSPYLDNRLPEYNSILKFSFLSNLWANLANSSCGWLPSCLHPQNLGRKIF